MFRSFTPAFAAAFVAASFIPAQAVQAAPQTAQLQLVQAQPTPPPRRRPPPPPAYLPEAPKWDATGWTLLGQRTVNGRRSRDAIEVGAARGEFTHLTVVVKNADLEINQISVVFGNGQKFDPKVRHNFRNGARTRAIDLPGSQRKVRRVVFGYGRLTRGRNAVIALYGRAAPAAPVYRPEPPKWDATGWTLLGRRTVNGRRDRDVINIGARRGAFTHLTVVVTNADLEMNGIDIVFGNGQRYGPDVRHRFGNGTRTRAIDLPGRERKIQRIGFRYGDLTAGRSAVVGVYGRRAVPVYSAEAPSWDSAGWTLIGQKQIDTSRGFDNIGSGRVAQGPFSDLTVVVKDSDLDVSLFRVDGPGGNWGPRLRHRFRNGARTLAFTLPRQNRQVRNVLLRYGNITPGRRPLVLIYGKAAAPEYSAEAPRWDSSGWVLLGRKTVNASRDRDFINVGRRGPYSDLTLVVSDADLSLADFEVTFDDNKKWSPNLRHDFKNGSRSRAVHLPNNRDISRLDFGYGGVTSGRRAVVAIYAKEAPRPPVYRAEPPNWDARGWTLLGERRVDGRRDRDVFTVANRGAFTELAVVVHDGDVKMSNVEMVFGNDEKHTLNLRKNDHFFNNGARSWKIGISGYPRNVKKLAFSYGNLSANGRARMLLYGKTTADRPSKPAWQPNGWTKLGEKIVNGSRDRDVFNLQDRGAFTHLMVVVSDNDLAMDDINIVFGNGQKHSPELRHTFKNGSRSRPIDLPGHARNIKEVRFRYGNLAGYSQARVALWGINKEPKPTRPSWDPTGWSKLGEKWVSGRNDRDVFNLRGTGAFTHLTVVVSESDLLMNDIDIEFGNGERYSPKLRHEFKNGSRSRAIDLPGGARAIKKIAFRYGNLPGSGRASVAVYGRNDAPKPTAPSWSSTGWTRLGEKWVQGQRDRDVIAVGRQRGVFKALTLVVSESDLRMDELVVTFGNREKFSPKVRHLFKNGSRTRRIDLPGSVRNIQNIELKYGNVPGNGRAKVAVWALPGENPATDNPADDDPAWNSTGWSKLGTRVVNGQRDRDIIRVGGYGERWKAVTFQVGGNDIEMYDVVVTFGNGKKWSPEVRHFFKAGSRTRRIDLPGGKRKIGSIEFRYGKLDRGGRATITAWAQ